MDYKYFVIKSVATDIVNKDFISLVELVITKQYIPKNK